MFDAKSLLEMMVRGAAPQRPTPTGDAGGLGELLGQLGHAAPGGKTGAGGLDDIVRQITGAAANLGQSASDAGGRSAGSAAEGPAGSGAGAGSVLGGLGDLLGRVQSGIGQAQGSGRGQDHGTPPNIMDVLGQVLGQATSGVREGAGKMDAASGASEAIRKMTGGQSVEDLLAKFKELVAQNQFGAGAAAGGLGAVILGTETGRGIAANAAKLGALALIGGLAYKAYTNYQAGKPLITGADALAEAAPDGSGFEPDSVTNEAAILYIRAMIAAAAADGRVDPAEMANIVGHLKQAGFDAAAEEFIAGELNAPATADELAASCIGTEQAVQVYTAARMAVTLDSPAEKAFLADLASKLAIAPDLAAHIEAAMKSQVA